MKFIIFKIIFYLILLVLPINCSNAKIYIPKTKESLIKEIKKEYKKYLFLESELMKYKYLENCLTKNLILQTREKFIIKNEIDKLNHRFRTQIINSNLQNTKLLNEFNDKKRVLLLERDNTVIKQIKINYKLQKCIYDFNNLAKKVSDRELAINGFPSFLIIIDNK